MFGREKYNPGDILECRKGMVKHYGVYIGNGDVIHFASDSRGEVLNPSEARIRQTSLRKFSYGELITVNNSSNRLGVDAIVANAKSQLGDTWGGYNQMCNNSEHFARWCETGTKSSCSGNSIANGLASILKGFLG